MTQRGYGDGWPDWAPPDEDYTTEKEAKRRVRGAAALAAVIFGVLGFGAGAVWGETIHIGGMHINGAEVEGSPVTIKASDVPGVLAVVSIHNRSVNQSRDNGLYPLTLGDLTVQVEFGYNVGPAQGADRFSLIVPDGIICDPESCSVTLMEGFTGQVTLFDWRGM